MKNNNKLGAFFTTRYQDLLCSYSQWQKQIMCISYQLHIQWCHIGRLKLAIVGVFTLQKLENAVNQGFVFQSWLLNI